MSEYMREAVRRVARLFPTAIISGRGREKVEQFVQLKELFYAGSHGMDIAAPKIAVNGVAEDGDTFQPAAQYEPLMKLLWDELWDAVRPVPGATVENNKFCVSVHFRNCAPDDYDKVMDAVDDVMTRHQDLHVTRGRKVLEVRPKLDWNKGSALLHLVNMLGLDTSDVYCLYIGDDRTDEDAFQVLSETGTGSGILVSTKRKDTAGKWTLKDPTEVAAFLYRLVAWGHTSSNKWHQKGTCNGWCLISETQHGGGDAAAAMEALRSIGLEGKAKGSSVDGFSGLSAAGKLAHARQKSPERPPLPPRGTGAQSMR